jgi:hypothetical protein
VDPDAHAIIFIVIIYPHGDYSRELLANMREATKHYSLYGEGPEIAYTRDASAYAIDITLLHDRNRSPQELIDHGPSKTTRIALATRAGGGHGRNGERGGVTGYLDPGRDKGLFDPVDYTVYKELEEECYFTDETLRRIIFRAGRLTVQPRSQNPEATITVAHILGLTDEELAIITNPKELQECVWYDLRAVQNGEVEDLKPGYRDVTLPATLAAIAIQSDIQSGKSGKLTNNISNVNIV